MANRSIDNDEDDPRLGLPSASSLFRLALCPGSHALIRFLRENHKIDRDTSDDAASGLRIHESLAQSRRSWIGADSNLSERETETALKCFELRERVVREWCGDITSNYMTFVEERMFYRDEKGNVRFSGQPDYVAIDFRHCRALIIDYKTGHTESTPAADNMQLRALAVCLKSEYESLLEIDAAIVEPWVSHDVERVRYGVAELADAAFQLTEIAVAAERGAEMSTRIAGDWCKYCDARVHCPEARAVAVSVVHDFDLASIATDADLPTGDAGVQLYRKIKLAQRLLDDLERGYERVLAFNPDALPGYKLPDVGRARRYVANSVLFKESLAEYLSSNEIDTAGATFHLDKIRELFGLTTGLTDEPLRHKFESLIRDSLATKHDKPHIRELTRKEKQRAAIKAAGEAVAIEVTTEQEPA